MIWEKELTKFYLKKLMVFHVIKFKTLITGGNITLENVIIKDQSFLIKKEGTLLVKLPKPRNSKLIRKKN